MDYVMCSGSEYQLRDCDYDVYVTEIDYVPRTDCAYCEYIPFIGWIKLSVQGQYVLVNTVLNGKSVNLGSIEDLCGLQMAVIMEKSD